MVPFTAVNDEAGCARRIGVTCNGMPTNSPGRRTEWRDEAVLEHRIWQHVRPRADFLWSATIVSIYETTH
jgi:hypothetical protein